MNINLPDAVPREEHEALKQRVEDIESLLPPQKREVAVRELSKSDPVDEIVVSSDTSVIGKDYAEEIRGTLEDAGWQATSGIHTGDVPEGITVSGLASGLVSAAFEQADLYMKENPTDKTGPTYIVVGLMKDQTKD